MLLEEQCTDPRRRLWASWEAVVAEPVVGLVVA